MKFKDKYFHCGDFLQNSLKTEIEEISQCISNMKWKPDFGGVFFWDWTIASSVHSICYIINLNVEGWVLFSLSGNIVETPFSAGRKAAQLEKIVMYLVI